MPPEDSRVTLSQAYYRYGPFSLVLSKRYMSKENDRVRSFCKPGIKKRGGVIWKPLKNQSQLDVGVENERIQKSYDVISGCVNERTV